MQHELPSFPRLFARLAADNERVMRFIDRLPQRVDALVDALQRSDAGELRRLSENMATTSEDCGLDTIRYRAERVCQELLKPNNLRGIKRSVVHLIGACGGVRRHDQGVTEDWQI
jgi:hypothetical protein